MDKKIGYVVHTFPRLTLTFVLREILALEAMGVEVVVFSLRQPANQTVIHPEFRRMAAPIICVPKWNQSLKTVLMTGLSLIPFCRYPGRLVQAFSFIARSRNKAVLYDFFRSIWMARQMHILGVNHLHAHAATFETMVAMFTALLSGRSYSFTAHASDIFPQQEFLSKKLDEASFAVAISEYNRKFLMDHYGHTRIGDKIHVVHCGVELNSYLPRTKASPSDKFIIITVARLAEQKGHHILLKALSVLKEDGYDFCWLVVGHGPRLDVLETGIHSEGLNDYVNFVGDQSTETVQALLQQADLFVLPCIKTVNDMMDGIPVALMEAMALGVPVVSTHLSGIPELIENEVTGFLVPEKDVAALTQVIERIMNNQVDLDAVRMAARRKIEESFTAETNAALLNRLFDRYITNE